MCRAAIIGLFIASAASVAAEEVAVFPEACDPKLTIQAVDCTVTHYALCAFDGEAAAMQVRYDGSGLRQSQILDADNHPLRVFSDTIDLRFDESVRADRMSSSILLAKGTDGYAFTLTSETAPISKMTFFGSDELTAKTVIANGFHLRELRGRYVRTTYFNGRSVTEAFEVEQYVEEEFGFFVPVRETRIGSAARKSSEQAPVDFLRPGDDGFLSVQPLYCGPGASS